MIEDFLVPFAAVGLAELGDKTQIAILMLSIRVEKRLLLLVGALLAFLVVDGFAVFFGELLSRVVPLNFMGLVSGLTFLVIGFFCLLGSGEFDRIVVGSPLQSGFTFIFLSELGDKTQVASFLFAVQYNPLLVFLGVMLSLAILSVLAVYFGELLGKKLSERMLQRFSGLIFVAIGLWIVVSWMIS